MKNLVLIRHAKSSWSNPRLSDKNRPLNDRGLHDAPLMAKIIGMEFKKPDLILCSSSIRTRQTVQYFLDEWAMPNSGIKFLDDIYHASSDQLMKLIREMNEDFTSIAIVGHNPGLTYLLQELIHSDSPDNIATCGIAILKSNSEYWSSFDAGNPSLLKYFYPKKHLDVYK